MNESDYGQRMAQAAKAENAALRMIMGYTPEQGKVGRKPRTRQASIAEVLAGREMTAEDIARTVGSNARNIDAILRGMEAQGDVTRDKVDRVNLWRLA